MSSLPMDDQKNKEIILTIKVVQNDLKVEGPINNEPLALWMLEKAKDIIKAHNIMANQPKIEKPNRRIFNFLK